MQKRCPWVGKECDCQDFPWLVNDTLPAKCEQDMPMEMAGVRKVSPQMKARYRLYLMPCKKCKQRFEKNDQSITLCQRCETVAAA